MKNYILREVGHEALMAAIIEQAREDAKKANEKANVAYEEMKKANNANAKRVWEKKMLKYMAEEKDAMKAVREWRKELEDLLLPSIY